jgi:predicted Zn-dependent peptidase
MYRPERMVFFVLGDIEFKRIIRTVEKLFDGKSALQSQSQADANALRAEAAGEAGNGSRHIVEHRSTHQAHVMMGCKGFPSKDNRRIALYFLNNILGGPGMNSRLNVALREHHGLVYTVESTLTNYTDTGTFAIYFGCDPDDVKKCQRLVRKELDRFVEKPLTERQMKACIKQMTGQIRVACENHENYALDMAKSFLHYGKFEGIDETLKHLNSLTPEFVQEVAAEVFSEDNITIVEFVP